MFWVPVATALPAPLEDVLVYQRLDGMGDDDNTLIRSAYRNQSGQWIDTYTTDVLTGGDEVLRGVTHWSPLPEGPDGDMVSTVSSQPAAAEYDGDRP
jgi:hypothetical protein